MPSTNRFLITGRRTALTAVCAAAAAAIAVAALGGTADASTSAGTSSTAAIAATPTRASQVGGDAPPGQAPSTSTQQGFVVEGSGSAGGYSAYVSLYANSLHGNQLEVAIETPDGRTVVPARGQSQPSTLFSDGRIAAQADAITRDEEGNAVAAGSIDVAGSYELSGKPTRPNGALRDNGEVVVTRGTNTALAAQVTVTYGDVVIPVQVSNAFAFDLVTLDQPIGN